jgi:Ca2+-binding EF-hand superfamily protein
MRATHHGRPQEAKGSASHRIARLSVRQLTTILSDGCSLSKIGVKLRRGDLPILMKIFDKDASGAIDIEEFYDVLVSHPLGRSACGSA